MHQDAPPRLLTGIALLFWGGLTGHPFAGLIAAVLVESRSWLSIRWDFSRESYVRAWHISIFCGALLSMLAWLNGVKVGKLHSLFVWSPLTLLPLELAQRYGKAALIPLNTFSFFARRKMQRDLKHGYHVKPRMINTGYIYLAIVMLATAVASRDDTRHFIGLAIIFGACLFFNARKHGFRPIAWAASFLMIVAISYAGQWSMSKLYHYYSGGRDGDDPGRHTSANESRTNIGRLGRIKLSPHIFWRMWVESAEVPSLLRTATYNQYYRATWKHIPQPEESDTITDEEDNEGYNTSGRLDTERDIRYFGTEIPTVEGAPDVRIIGEVDSAILSNPLPMPHFTKAIGDLGNKDSEVSIACNSLGTVLIDNPDYHVVSYSVWRGNESTTEVDAPAEFDLKVPAAEQEAIRRVCADLGLKKGMSAQKILLELQQHFSSNFKYTTHLTTPGLSKSTRGTAIGSFLEDTRAGHCEYFATATCLILRECGIPARYCVGFAVTEFDAERGEWVMRGKHAHAWVRVWDKDHWEDADLTPPSWEAMEQIKIPAWRLELIDWWQRVREDFLIWRTSDENKTTTAIVVGLIVGLVLFWFGWRLWKSRHRDARAGKSRRYAHPPGTPLTALNKLESAISRKIGPRPSGLPLGRWVMQLEGIDPSLNTLISPLTKLHSEARFDPEGDHTNKYDEIARLSAELKKRLKTLSPVGSHSLGKGSAL
ncbi:hypothetical protein NT6N_12220 [Oceaniferula spumae]|uniref:Transglutaminase-like domain-containing protein n=1 Tax=Oceaniferula spumae TaxID=2979115 RepID=A0AAT9FJR0_9BACT